MFGSVLVWQDPQMAAYSSSSNDGGLLLLELFGEQGLVLVSSMVLIMGLKFLERQQQQMLQQQQKPSPDDNMGASIPLTVQKWGM